MNDIKLFTTPVLQGVTIEKYIDVVTANQVAGTGFFTDLTAAFSDLFGGNSGAYRESMNTLYKNVIDQLKDKARSIQANAVIDLKVDYDSISAKNMSMFMVSVQGTAVVIRDDSQELDTKDNQVITLKEFNDAIQLKHIKDKLSNSDSLMDAEWKFIVDNKDENIAPTLHKAYNHWREQSLITDTKIDYYTQYLSSIPYEKAIDVVYSDEKPIHLLIKKSKLFSASKLLEYSTTHTPSQTADYIDTEKLSYTAKDLQDMKALLDYFDHLPVVWKEVEEKGGFLSKGGKKLQCTCGYNNNLDQECCASCGNNRYGLSFANLKNIKDYKLKVEVLEEIFSK